MKRIVSLFFGVILSFPIFAEVKYQEADSTLFLNYLRYVNHLGHAPSMSETGMFFLNTPYVAGMLDEDGNEPLVMNMRQLDCVTFVEHTLALTLLMRRESRDWNDYVALLQQLRYRNGQRDGYASRLHYLSEWIKQAEENGFVKETTCEWGGKEQKVVFNLLTEAIKRKQDKNVNPDTMNRLLYMEHTLSEHHYCCLPKDSLPSLLNDGDIIAFCSDGKGIDVWHVGIVVHRNGVPHLLHASSAQGRVVVSELSILDYMRRYARYRGYRIVRLK